ncbi:MAG: TlyA family RNA methyltransferase [Sulfurospirillum sp.]|nr:TlyA family RNA methyltransferase [Sulfurospirillum sp.]
MRLDSYLFEKALALSRNKASEMIKNREVFVDGKVIIKPSFEVDEQQTICIEENIQFVSRAGYKLNGFLQELGLDISGMTCLDVGSSTGGFTQVLLSRNVKKVVSVDVGTDQLHVSLRNDAKIELHEGCDIRKFNTQEYFDLLTCDVSFVSLETLMQDLDRLAQHYLILLFKPQFEVGKSVKRTKNGVVKDNAAIVQSMNSFESKAFAMGWELVIKSESVLKGKEGNVETFYCFKKR